LKITAIKTAVIVGVGPAVFVRVYTDEGIVGLGECYPSAPASAIRDTIHHMSELLIGEDPRNVDMLYEKVRRGYLFRGAQGGTVITALSGVEIALWDITGKALGAPVYQLLGGKFRDRIRIYADCHAGKDDSPAAYAEEAQRVVALGYNAIKFDVDDINNPDKLDIWNWSVTPKELDGMIRRVAAVRDAVGPEIDIAIDMHARYNIDAACKFAQAMEPFNLMWLEEPVPPENMDALLKVRQSTRTPICVGENAYTRFQYRDMFQKQATDIVMPDIMRMGGLSEARKVANMAELYYIPVAPHCVSSPVGMMAACHVCASIPNFLTLEFHGLRREHWASLIVGDKSIIQNGYVTVTDKPGLGVELDDEIARQHVHTRMGGGYFED
jgi:galactonate dehydratase